MRKLRDYQSDVLRWSKERMGIPLFIEMRLGKTLIHICSMMLRGASPNLIVCPKTVIPVWKFELKQEGVDIEKNVFVLSGSVERKAETLDLSRKAVGQVWILTNYEAITAFPLILEHPFESICLDESTAIKNPSAKITKLLVNRTEHIPLKTLLTGIPAPESIMNYFEQMRFAFGKFMGFSNFWSWRNTLFVQFGYDWVPKRGVEERIMTEVKRLSYFLTRKDVNLGGKRIYTKRYFYMDNPEQKKMYKELARDFLTTHKDKEFSTKYVPVKLEWMQRVAEGFTPDGKTVLSDAKNKEILRLLQTELLGEKVVVWFKHNDALQRCAEFLKAKKISVGVLFGDKDEDVDGFKGEKFQVLCAQQKKGMRGLDLSVSSTAIYHSCWWSHEIRAQSEERIFRAERKEPMLFIDLVTKYSVEEDIFILLKTKKLDYREFVKNLRSRMENHLKKLEERG